MLQRRVIQQLSPALVNRIAAGEVIERPASVVKELVENSIDAGSTHITVEIEDGGRELIRITDNGCGIPLEELPLAFAQHATSKLACDEDLFRIATMGFRGEALASIGAVSHARLLSRVAGRDEAWEIHNRGGEISAPQAAAGNVGTSIEIRNLFFNTPARRKFLKGAATELGHISEMVLRLALPYPAISFELLSDGRSILKLPATSPVQRMLAAWPDDFHEQRLSLEFGDAELRLGGIIGLPELARPTAKYQYVYLNGRFIRDKFIQHALKEGYRGLTEPGRHPAAILMLTIPPADVDVNVHPTKIEVRFRDSSRIHGLVLASVREKLLGSDLTPSAHVGGQDEAPAAATSEARQQLADFFRSQFPGSVPPAPAAGAVPADGSAAGTPGAPAPAAGNAAVATAPPNPMGISSATATSFTAPPLQLEPPLPQQATIPFPAPPRIEAPRLNAQDIGRREAGAAGATPNHPAPAPTVSSPTGFSGVRAPAIQLHNTYLVTESPEGMLIIDQHALHERILYEELVQWLSRGPLESQPMLIPEPVKASPRQVALLEQIQPLLQKLGIELTPFGPGTIAVQAFPTFLHRLSPSRFVRELLERGEQELLDMHQEELLHDILDMMACKAAVKAGDPLTPEEIDALLTRRELCDRSSNCPHGRPTILRMSLKELEKQFKRTGF
jgi:DNA mismatch repair protein MutL